MLKTLNCHTKRFGPISDCHKPYFSVLSVAGSEAAPVGDHHAAPDGGRGTAQAAARGLPAQLLTAAAAEEHCQGRNFEFPAKDILENASDAQGGNSKNK